MGIARSGQALLIPIGIARDINDLLFDALSARRKNNAAKASLHFSPPGEAKWVRGLSGRGARRLARAGVLEQYVEHGKQAQRSPDGRIACFDRRVVRNAG